MIWATESCSDDDSRTFEKGETGLRERFYNAAAFTTPGLRCGAGQDTLKTGWGKKSWRQREAQSQP